jgi:uncharacterized membrane protein YgdD (TMEM256/DUF423 family)
MAAARPSLIALGAVNAAIALGASTIAAHSLSNRASEVFETGARYQMYHALAMVLAGILARTPSTRGAQIAGWIFQAGIVLFSGSLYVAALTGDKELGSAPLGGISLLVGWLWFAWTTWRATPAQ